GLYICSYTELSLYSSRRRHTRSKRDWSSDVCSSDLGKDKVEVKITEKLDGSNLTLFKHPETGRLGIGQRNIIYYMDQIDTDEVKQVMYKGLRSWLSEHGEHLQKELHNGSAIVGEWLGMGQIGYDLN